MKRHIWTHELRIEQKSRNNNVCFLFFINCFYEWLCDFLSTRSTLWLGAVVQFTYHRRRSFPWFISFFSFAFWICSFFPHFDNLCFENHKNHNNTSRLSVLCLSRNSRTALMKGLHCYTPSRAKWTTFRRRSRRGSSRVSLYFPRRLTLVSSKRLGSLSGVAVFNLFGVSSRSRLG